MTDKIREKLDTTQVAYIVMLLLMREANKWHEYIVERGWSQHSEKYRINLLIQHYKTVQQELVNSKKAGMDHDFLDDLSEVFSQIAEKVVTQDTMFDAMKAIGLLQAYVEGKVTEVDDKVIMVTENSDKYDGSRTNFMHNDEVGQTAQLEKKPLPLIFRTGSLLTATGKQHEYEFLLNAPPKFIAMIEYLSTSTYGIPYPWDMVFVMNAPFISPIIRVHHVEFIMGQCKLTVTHLNPDEVAMNPAADEGSVLKCFGETILNTFNKLLNS